MERKLHINIEFEGRKVRIPEILENIHIGHGNPPNIANIVSKGPVSYPSYKSVKTITWDNSQFWKEWIERFQPGGMTPRQYVNFLTEIRDSLKPCRLIMESDIETYPQNMLALIDFPDWEIRHSEMHDIHYNIVFYEHELHKIDLLNTTQTQDAAGNTITQYTPEPPPRISELAKQTETVTVQSGDSLWKISQRITGNGANWRELYNLNKEVIHERAGAYRFGSLIHPGQVLRVPDTWIG